MTRIKSLATRGLTYQEPNDNNNQRFILLCRLETEDGIVGWGEAITQFAPSTRAAATLAEALSELLIGKHVEDNVALWKEIRRETWWYGYKGGIMSFVLSALDIAMWDLKGKVLGLPVVQLLGGAVRQKLPVIASTHAFDSSLDVEIERHAGYIREGFKGIKIGMGKRGDARLGYEIKRDVDFVAGLREAIGPAAWLMMDRGKTLDWNLKDTIERVSGFCEHDLLWIEEPFEPDQTENFRALRQHVPCMIGGAEREWDPEGFASRISESVLDVIGCDPGRAGGITGAVEVVKLVERANIWFNAHAWSSGIISAASLAISASTERCLLFEVKPITNPMQDELIVKPLRPENGEITVLTEPGLGIEVDEKVVEKYRFV